MTSHPQPARQKIVIVGGGPAGLEAARVSAERGHDVVLFEATGTLGGQIVLAARASWRKDLIGIVDWLEQEVTRLGVDIRWDTYAEFEEVAAENPDVVLIATGGVPDTEFVPGGAHCLSTWDVLAGKELTGSVLVYDDNGQPQGPSCADVLGRKQGVAVELVTPDRAAAMDMGVLNYPRFMESFYQLGVKITPDHRLTSVEKQGNRLRAIFGNVFGGPDIERIVDHLVVEHGTLPMNGLFEELRSHSCNDGAIDHALLISNQPQVASDQRYQLFCIGDAVSSRNIHAAIYDALRLCKDL